MALDVVTLSAAKNAAKVLDESVLSAAESMIEEATGDIKPIKILSDTLEAGDTEIVFTDTAIASAVRCEVFAWDKYLQFSDIEKVGTSLTIYFDEQDIDIDVAVYLYDY